MTRCTCPECCDGDALPERLQGWPGACQLLMPITNEGGRKMSNVWTDEAIAELRRQWDQGKTASEIAKAMGPEISRNAVIGKAHRLGLPSRPSPIR